MTELSTEAEAISELAVAGTKPVSIDPLDLYVLTVPLNGEHHIIDLEHALDNPRRKKGTVTLHEAESFAAYVNKHKLADVTEIYADVTAQSVVAVINDDAPQLDGAGDSAAGWRDHRAVLALKRTDPWNIWRGIDGHMLGQVAFAEHIEANAADIVEPDAATMLELAQTLEVKKDVEFKSSNLLANGQRQLTFHEKLTEAGGANGTLEIPKEIVLGIAPFEIGGAYKVTARFRYRMADGRLTLGIKIDRPEDVIRSAFKDVIDTISDQTDLDLLYGTPAS